MAPAPVDSPSDDHLRIDSIPVVDLRFLSQSDLHALSHLSAASSPAALDPRSCDNDVVSPKIDRSVFNESAGSRKQTYSRLRLAPRKPHSSSPSSTTTTAAAAATTNSADPDLAENHRIIRLLKELFGEKTNGDELVPIRVECSGLVGQLSNEGKKRKRGRPRKNENLAVAAAEVAEVVAEGGDNVVKDIVVYENVEDKDREIVNRNGYVVDLVALAGSEDPYHAELRRRTENFKTEEEFLVFMGGLNGKWASWRRKKRIVDACEFGDALPKGWKLLLSLKKKQGIVWSYVHRYISPNGRQFLSCKEVSSYLLSLFGLPDPNRTNCGQSDQNIQLTSKMACGNAADLSVKDANKRGDLVSYSPLVISCVTNDPDKQVTSEVGSSGENQMGVIFKCNKCTMTFSEKDDLLHHQLSSHRRKRSRLGTSITDGVIIKGGQYECQFCHKTFTERHRYNGHVGAHLRHHMRSDEASPGVLSMQNIVDPVPLFRVPPKESMMQTSVGHDYNAVIFNVNANSVLKPASPQSKSKAATDIESCADRSGPEVNVLSHDAQDSKSNYNSGNFGEEFNFKDNRRYMMNNCLGGVDKANDVVAPKFNSSSNSEAAKSDDGNNSISEFAANKSYDCPIGQERNLESRPCSPFPIETTRGDEVNVNGDATNVEQPNQEAGSESVSLAPCAIEEIHGIGNMEDVHSMQSFIPDTVKFDDKLIHGFCGSRAGPEEEDVSEDKQQNVSGGCSSSPISNDQKCDNSDCLAVVSTSALAESKQKRGSESSNEETCGVKDSYRVSTSSVFHPMIDARYKSGNKEVLIGYGGGHAGIEEDDINKVEQENSDSHLLVPSWKDKLHDIKDKGNVVSVRAMEGCCSDLPGCELTCGVKNDVNDIAIKKMEEPELDKVQTYRNNELAFGKSDLRLDTLGRSLEFGSLLLSGNEQTFAEENVAGDCNSTEVPLKQKGSFNDGFSTQSCTEKAFGELFTASTIEEPKPDEFRNSINSERIIAFDNNDSAIVADVMDNVPIEQTFSFKFNRSRENSRIGKDPNEESSLLGSSFYSRTCADENNLSRVNPGRVWEGPIIDEGVNSGPDYLSIGFGSSNAQSVGDVMPGSMWRTDEEDILQSTLSGTSTQLEQSSSCFPAFTLISDKGDNELLGFNGKYDSMSGFEGAQSDHIEHVEFSFLTTQHLSSLPGDSKAYNSEVGPGFDSSFWLGKDALSLNLAARNQVTSMCIWCRNEFLANAGTQTGAIGTVCPTCNTKVSQQFNFF